MKRLLLIPVILFSISAAAQKETVVESGTLTTAPGINGEAQTGFAFAKGDVITITANANKKLDRMLVLLHPDVAIGRAKHTKTPKYTFTMPKDGITVIRFISDRTGTTNINYTVSRVPASAEVQEYNTKVTWEPPAGAPGPLVPKRAGG